MYGLSEAITRITEHDSPEELELLLKHFFKQEVAMHGIHDERSIGNIAVHGVWPNCPDVTPQASFWTSRERMFFSGDPVVDGNTLDTSFFHWAHSRSIEPNVQVMSLALTNKDVLRSHVENFSEARFDSGYFTVDSIVPSDQIQLVTVRQPTNALRTPRQNGQTIERAMLHQLVSIAEAGISFGTHTT